LSSSHQQPASEEFRKNLPEYSSSLESRLADVQRHVTPRPAEIQAKQNGAKKADKRVQTIEILEEACLKKGRIFFS
jgi:hypothetical protein